MHFRRITFALCRVIYGSVYEKLCFWFTRMLSAILIIWQIGYFTFYRYVLWNILRVVSEVFEIEIFDTVKNLEYQITCFDSYKNGAIQALDTPFYAILLLLWQISSSKKNTLRRYAKHFLEYWYQAAKVLFYNKFYFALGCWRDRPFSCCFGFKKWNFWNLKFLPFMSS